VIDEDIDSQIEERSNGIDHDQPRGIFNISEANDTCITFKYVKQRSVE
jgi:hypothetical protein